MSLSQPVIQIFAKAPVVGEVKTRLIPSLGEEGATALYCRLLRHIVDVAVSSQLASVELWCAPDTSHPFFDTLQGVTLYQQQGDGLGERMYFALEQGLSRGGPVVLIGCDCPAMDEAYLAGAFEMLRAGRDVVLGPVEDGGYGLIGGNRVDPLMFDGLDWGTDSVFDETLSRVKQLDWSCGVLPLTWDLDRAEDLGRLPAHFTLE